MVVLLEKHGTKRCAMESTNIEPFTQKPFIDLIQDSHGNKKDYYLVRIRCVGKGGEYFCYDARQMCKYVFEMVISLDGRRIQVKNKADPIFKSEITEICFFRLKYDTETPLRAEYVGNQTDFLESNAFRSKIFFNEDPLDSLTVNFQLKNMKTVASFNKKQIFVFMIMVFAIMSISSVVIYTLEKNRSKLGVNNAESLFNRFGMKRNENIRDE